MVPPIKIRYYYTVQVKEYGKKQSALDVQTLDEGKQQEELFGSYETEASEIQVPKTNILDDILQKRQLLTSKKLRNL